MNTATSFFQAFNASPTDPAGTTVSALKKGIASNNSNTPTFGTIRQSNSTANPQENISPQNQGNNTNIFMRPGIFVQSQPVPQVSTPPPNQSTGPQAQKISFNHNNQNMGVNQQNQGLFHPNSVPIMTA